MKRSWKACVLVVGLLATSSGRFAWAAEPITLEVAAGDHDRAGVPVFFALPESLRGAPGFRLVRIGDGGPTDVPVQREAVDPPRVVWLMRDPLPAGKTRRYRLTAVENRDSAQAVRCVEDGGVLRVTVGDRPALVYNAEPTRASDRKQSYYDRSGFLHPVMSPSGRVITDDLNPDHMHQHGIMYAWRQCEFEGHAVDFWDEKAQLGKIAHVKTESVGGGPVFAHFTVHLAHRDLTLGGKPVLNETWRVRVYNLARAFLFDLESVQTCATSSPLTVKKFHYGGVAVRGSKQWKKGVGFDFLTSEGKTRTDGNHTRARWCAIAGAIDGKPAGLTVLSHPDNFRAPQPVRLHPSMPYYCWAPMVPDAFNIEPARPFVSRYRFIAYDGQTDAAVMERMWQDYAHPVAVRVVAGR